MVPPQEGILGPACCPVLAAGIRWRGLRACDTAWRDSLKQAGALPDCQPPTPGAGPLSVMQYT